MSGTSPPLPSAVPLPIAAVAAPPPVAPPPPGPRSVASREIGLALWGIVRLPLQILVLGAAVLLLLNWASSMVFQDTSLGTTLAALTGNDTIKGFVATLVFMVGLGFAAFLWWLASRYFNLLTTGNLTADQIADLRDLPLALPEGTVRALLALIVAVVGLPILLFSGALNLSPEISGYVNGIIAGVFGFYFGTRTSGVPTQAVNQIADAQKRVQAAEQQRDNAQSQAQQARSTADATTRAGRFDAALDQLQRHVSLGAALLDVIAPALPQGILPAGFKNAVDTAQSAVAAVQGVTQDTVTDEQLSQLTSAAGSLIGSLSGGTSALGSLLSTAAPMLGGIAIPGLGPVAAIASLVAIGARLGSAEFQRWRARVLAAPIATGLIEFGTVTPDDVQTCLQDSPRFKAVFATMANDPGVMLILADAVLRDDGSDRLWQRYGISLDGQSPLFANRAELEGGLLELRQALLARRSSSDVPSTLPPQIATVLGLAQASDVRPPANMSVDHAAALTDAASRASLAATLPEKTRAAFDALVTLTGIARVSNVDLATAIGEVRP